MTNLTFLPEGAILMWNGENWEDNKTLVGWWQCNGQIVNEKKTPNLTDRFIRGTSTEDRPVAQDDRYGGQNTKSVILPGNAMPKHKHSVSGPSVGGANKDLRGFMPFGPYANHLLFGSGSQANHNIGSGIISNTLADGVDGFMSIDYDNYAVTIDINHKHDVTGSAVAKGGGSFSVSAVPKYYSVIYIRKMV
ncbi:MAG: hypothetical protein LBD99_06735 [Candidatus Margulisbacteria bacterium]|nr:hypothetical protein [Candidatus Margulisiibacteriota bacterium]